MIAKFQTVLVAILLKIVPSLGTKEPTAYYGTNSSIGKSFVILNRDWGNVPLDEIPLSAPELIVKNGYPFECHSNIVTKDGYILTAHRLPYAGRPVVVMFHGMTQTSRDFLMNRKHKAPAYKMWEAGFDVWLVNARGNSYSRGHVRLGTTDPDYWNFSVDEVIRYDAPALIDYILNANAQSSLNWIGYSLGSAVGMGLSATQPQYNSKINLLILIGTTAYVGSTKGVVNLVTPFARLLDILSTTLNHGELVPTFLFPTMRIAFPLFCMPEAKVNAPGICSFILFIISGFNLNQANPEMLPIMLGGTPGSISVKMVVQWFQWIKGGLFTYFDFGEAGNIQKYGSTLPPIYKLRDVKARVVNLYAQNDWLAPPQDVLRTVSELPNVALNIKIKMESWTHLDYIYAKDADLFVYQEIISAINNLTLLHS